MNRGILKKSLPLKAVHADIPETAEPSSDNSQSEEHVQSQDDANTNEDGANSAVPPSSAPCENKKSKGPRKLKNQNLRAVDSIRVASDRFEHSPRSRFLKKRKQTDSTSPGMVKDRASFPYPTTGGTSLSRQVPSSDTPKRHSSPITKEVQNDTTDYLCDRESTDDNKQIHFHVQDYMTDPNVENTNTPVYSADTSGDNHPFVPSDLPVPSNNETSDDLCVATQAEKSDISVCSDPKTPDDSHACTQAASPDSNVSLVLETYDTIGHHVSREIVDPSVSPDPSESPPNKETPDSPSSLIFPEKCEETESFDPYETSHLTTSQDDDHSEITDISDIRAPYEPTADDNLITDDIFTLLKDNEASRSSPMNCDNQDVIIDSAVTEVSDTNVLPESKLQPSPDQVLNQSLLVNDNENMCTSEELSNVTPVSDLSNTNMETVENEAESSATSEAIRTSNQGISAVEYLMEYDEEETLV